MGHIGIAVVLGVSISILVSKKKGNDIITKITQYRDAVDEEIITMDNVVTYFEQQKSLDKLVRKCVVSISEKREIDKRTNSTKIVFIQMLLDENGNPIPDGTDSYRGRTLYVHDTDMRLREWLNGSMSKILET